MKFPHLMTRIGIVILMVSIMCFLFMCLSSSYNLCCGLKGVLLFTRENEKGHMIILKHFPDGSEQVIFQSEYTPYYQISPTGKQLLVECERQQQTLFYVVDLKKLSIRRIYFPPKCTSGLWVNESIIAALQPYIGEIWYDLRNGRVKVVHKFSNTRVDIPSTEYLEYLQRHFGPQLHNFLNNLRKSKFKDILKFGLWPPSDPKTENLILPYLRTTGVKMGLFTEPIICGLSGSIPEREACISPNGLFLAFTYLEPRSYLCGVKIVDLMADKTIMDIVRPGMPSDLRWLPDGIHLLVSWSEIVYKKRFRLISPYIYKIPWRQDLVYILDILKHSSKIVTNGRNAFFVPYSNQITR